MQQPKLTPASLQLLGTCICDLLQHLGEGASASPFENALFREAITEAISLLSNREQVQKMFQKHGNAPSQAVHPLSLADLAQTILDPVSDDSSLSEDEQLARSEFALSLDPTCIDASLLQGEIAAKHHSYQVAREIYEHTLEEAAKHLGPEAFTEEAHTHFWSTIETRPYMRTRAALAYLLWQKMDFLEEALAHFQALLTLNPNDNQGNRFALLCCLLEAGQDTRLETALAQFRTTTDERGETSDLTDTTWHYTYACWLFRQQPPPKDDPLTSEATKALRVAFTYNAHVPHFLLTPAKLPDLEQLGPYARGDQTEAAMYATMALKGWQHTTGALPWLEAVARHAGHLSFPRRRKH